MNLPRETREPNPPPPWWTRRIHQTYSQWLRTATSLTPYDRKELEAEQQWLLDNPETAKALDAMVGTRMRLKKDKLALDDTRYEAGTLFHIVDHWGAHLHGFANIPDAELLVLRPEWLEGAVDAPATRNRHRLKIRRRGPKHLPPQALKPFQAQGQVQTEREILSLPSPPCSAP